MYGVDFAPHPSQSLARRLTMGVGGSARPPEQYAHGFRRNDQQAAVEVKRALFRGHPEVVDADLADDFGALPQSSNIAWRGRHIAKNATSGRLNVTWMPHFPQMTRHGSASPASA